MNKVEEKIDNLVTNYTKKEIKDTVDELCKNGLARGSYNYGCLIALLEVITTVEEMGK